MLVPTSRVGGPKGNTNSLEDTLRQGVPSRGTPEIKSRKEEASVSFLTQTLELLAHLAGEG